jgi:naphtho-gamma-pyrone polyketide synthase
MIWVEIGPHPSCSNNLETTLGFSSTRVLSALQRGEDDWTVFMPTLAALYESGLVVNWDDYHSGFKENLRVLRLPTYRWDLKSHWIPYAHDWWLTKGDPPVQCNHDRDSITASEPPTKKQPLTISVQDLVEERYTDDEAWIVARSDVHQPDFEAVLRGHNVNGQPLCTSAVYADMALTLFGRLLQRSPVAFDKTDMGVEVSDMVADKSLILNYQPVQLLEMKAQVQWPMKHATFSLSSIDSSTGKPTAHHARCTGTFTQKSRWKAEWSRRDYLIRSTVAHLRQSVDDDDSGVCQIKTGMFTSCSAHLSTTKPRSGAVESSSCGRSISNPLPKSSSTPRRAQLTSGHGLLTGSTVSARSPASP